jgi:hypothetical protein
MSTRFVKVAPGPLVILLCVACGPPRIGGSTSDDESSGEPTGSSTDSSSSTDSTSSSTDSSTSSTDDGSTLSDTHFFVPVGDIIEGNWCSPFPLGQGCPNGEKCVPYASTSSWWDSNKCVPVTGNQTAGEPCSYAGFVEATDDCDATSSCWNAREVEGELVGTCHSFCTGTEELPECPQDYECLLEIHSAVTLCFPTCDPVVQDCPNEIGCYWSGIAFICTASLELPGVSPGQPCGYVNDCEPGSLCLDASVMPDCMGSACCGSLCDLEIGDAQCAAVLGTTCVPFWEQGMAPVDSEHVGICIVGP